MNISDPTAFNSLVIESHPTDYTGLPFITLIQYSKQILLTIVDHIGPDTIRLFVLDLCGPAGVDEDLILGVAANWYTNKRGAIPLSVEFARLGITHITSQIYRTLNLEYVSRIIGPVITYPPDNITHVKRRRRKPVLSVVK